MDQLYSTRGQAPRVDLREAVFRGLPPDNGLYLPVEIPVLPDSFFAEIETLSFQEIAVRVALALLAGSLADEVIEGIVREAINFDAPLVEVAPDSHCLELFHGPSLAFKDFGARFMSRLMAHFLAEEAREINILVATSGDTGSAVGQGFLNVPGIRVTILYPKGKVSETQEKQLTTLGGNVTALEIDGVFDDCQRLVKSAFLDEELGRRLNLSSANSINIARLIPQSFYYFNAYARLKSRGKPLVISVPSGNFGNLCGGLIARRMGLPVARFIAATNANSVVPEYLENGHFRPRPSVATISNAMDVGNPSNFPRLTALLGDDFKAISSEIRGASYDDRQTRAAIKSVYQSAGYVMCPHTAVAWLGLRDYRETSGMDCSGVFLSTAHPAKFGEVVETQIGKSVEMPERLRNIVGREKRAVSMGKDFEDFKAWLLESI